MTASSVAKAVEVLLVEDDPADAQLTQETLKGSEYRLNVAVAQDGEVAMAYLRQEDEYSSAPRPDLILLDLRLPKKSGEEVLEEINDDPNLVQIPVMILTSTMAEQIRLATYGIPPGRYFEKPLDLKLFHQALGRLGLFSQAPIRMSSPEPQTTSPSEEPSEPSKRWWWPFGGR